MTKLFGFLTGVGSSSTRQSPKCGRQPAVHNLSSLSSLRQAKPLQAFSFQDPNDSLKATCSQLAWQALSALGSIISANKSHWTRNPEDVPTALSTKPFITTIQTPTTTLGRMRVKCFRAKPKLHAFDGALEQNSGPPCGS